MVMSSCSGVVLQHARGTGVLGAERTLELLLAPLQEAGRAGSGGDGSWRTIEAGLYCVRAVHRYWLSLGSLPRVGSVP